MSTSLTPCLTCRLHGGKDTKFCLQDQAYPCVFPAKTQFTCSSFHLQHGIPHSRDCYPDMNEPRNPTGYPGHHEKCRNIHSVRSHPCFPQRNDAHTQLQKRWLEENKENIPPPNLHRENASLHPKKYSSRKEEPEAIEEDDPESDSEEEEGHDGSQHNVSTISYRGSNNKPRDAGR